MKVIFSGGGTMGSVTPLVAIIEELKKRDPNIDYIWVGTYNGPEMKVIRNYNIGFKAICAGKLRRYFSISNLIDVFKILCGVIQSLIILIKFRPQVIVSAGGYVAVPISVAGWILGVPSIIHQQDIQIGLANKILAKLAHKITVCFDDSAAYFNSKKSSVVGNPVRESLKVNNGYSKELLLDQFKLKSDLPVVLVIGGGTGSVAINRLTYESIKELVKFCQVIHITGGRQDQPNKILLENYYEYSFLVDFIPVIQMADLVVSRAGMGSLTEIAYFKKPSIIIPMPNSHQEDNAAYFKEHGAAIVVEQKILDQYSFILLIKETLGDKKIMRELGPQAYNIMHWGAEVKIAKLILNC